MADIAVRLSPVDVAIDDISFDNTCWNRKYMYEEGSANSYTWRSERYGVYP